MTTNNNILSREMIKLLRKSREKANLTQAEIAKRLGLSPKSGKVYISALERGKKKNPSIETILRYLRACGASWVEFFKELDAIDFKLRHEKIISQLPRPPAKQKIAKDAMRYEIGIESPAQEMIDFQRLKKQIEDKISVLLIKNQIGAEQINSYQQFALEYFDFLTCLNKAGMKLVTAKWLKTGLELHLVVKIKKIINSVLEAEIKRITAKKPLPSAKQEKMAIGFTKYRMSIEQMEAEVHRLLCDLGVPTPHFALYKAFVRECYRGLRKYYGKNQALINKTFAEIIAHWKKAGLKEDVLLKLKEKIISVFKMMRLRGEV